jgi:ornithine carbamoyltransferase
VPVINALTDREHPCQIVADLLTIRERRGRLDGLKVAWIGDGNNMAVSWLHAAGALGLDPGAGVPRGLPAARRTTSPRPRDAGRDRPSDRRSRGGRGRRRRGHDRRLGVDGAGGRGAAAPGRLRRLLRRRCAPGPAAPDASCCTACRPTAARRSRGEVLDGPRGRAIWDQAENRLHTSKAILGPGDDRRVPRPVGGLTVDR